MNLSEQHTLVTADIERAIKEGIERREDSIRRGLKDKFPFPGTPEEQEVARRENDIQSRGSEIAAQRFFKLKEPVGATGSFHSPDLGTNVQIRWTKYRTGHLCIYGKWKSRPPDDLSHYYVLVTGEIPVFTFCGWLRGREVRASWWDKEKHAWWVPQGFLHPIGLLCVASGLRRLVRDPRLDDLPPDYFTSYPAKTGPLAAKVREIMRKHVS